MKNDIIEDYILIAKNAALEAGRFLKKSPRKISKVYLETKRDVKIRADLLSEQIILDSLRKKSIFSILSEEEGMIEGKDSRFIWIVDPLDGSLNYMRGIPFSCVSIGLWEGNAPVLGVVYDFNRAELFFGISGKKSWLNDKEIRASLVSQREKAILCTGFPVNAKFSFQNLKSFVQKIQNYRKIRLFGSAALSLVYVASGRVDAYIEEDIMFWDVAAGLAIACGSGCKFDINRGSRPHSLNVVVSNNGLKLC